MNTMQDSLSKLKELTKNLPESPEGEAPEIPVERKRRKRTYSEAKIRLVWSYHDGFRSCEDISRLSGIDLTDVTNIITYYPL